ncbi:MAG: tautomerase family protein [Candidatus Hadarchaeum sp.]|uniref:tautomerase family protein n=1 Tax=Candidatus Hadarchaeum sp. TaxID=2883567 RepID=UPI003D12A7A4
MPLVEISLTEGALTQEQKVRMANQICGLLMREIPNLPKESISVIFYDNPTENWIVGGLTIKDIV